MPTFLSKDQIYRMLQRELPEGLYPDGPASAFYSTADMGAVAKIVSTGYSNLQRIYDNFFPNYADERQADWEDLVFNKQLDSSLTLQQRRDAVLARIRTQRRTTPADIRQVVFTVVPTGTQVEVIEWGCAGWGWILDESLLDISTHLYTDSRLGLTGPGLCSKVAADFGLSEADYLLMREEAYTYEVRIYNYTLTADQRAELDAALLDSEPARSRHIISDGLDPADALDGSG